MEGPGPDWVRLRSVSCFSCHLSDGFINICCSFLPGHAACSLPGRRDRSVISQRENPRPRKLKAPGREGSLESGQDPSEDLRSPKAFSILWIKHVQAKASYFRPARVPDCAFGCRGGPFSVVLGLDLIGPISHGSIRLGAHDSTRHSDCPISLEPLSLNLWEALLSCSYLASPCLDRNPHTHTQAKASNIVI